MARTLKIKRWWLIVLIYVLVMLYGLSAVAFRSISWPVSGPGEVKLHNVEYLSRGLVSLLPAKTMCDLGYVSFHLKAYSEPIKFPRVRIGPNNPCSYNWSVGSFYTSWAGHYTKYTVKGVGGADHVTGTLTTIQ